MQSFQFIRSRKPPHFAANFFGFAGSHDFFYVYLRSATGCYYNGQRPEIRILKTMLGETP